MLCSTWPSRIERLLLSRVAETRPAQPSMLHVRRNMTRLGQAIQTSPLPTPDFLEFPQLAQWQATDPLDLNQCRSTLDPFTTPGVGERWRWRTDDDDDDDDDDGDEDVTTAEFSGCPANRRRSARELEETVYHGRREATTTPNVAFEGLPAFLQTILCLFLTWRVYKAKRVTSDITVGLPASDLTPGVWSPVASPPLCVTNGAISTISNGSKITYQFYGSRIINITLAPPGS